MSIKHEDWEEIARLYRSGALTADELCSVYHCPKKSLMMGISKIPKRQTYEDFEPDKKRKLADEIIAEKFGFGMSTKLIAEKHGLCVATVQKYIREYKKTPTPRKR